MTWLAENSVLAAEQRALIEAALTLARGLERAPRLHLSSATAASRADSMCGRAASLARELLESEAATRSLLIAEPAPTPAISYAVIRENADGAINFTASHNPPEYNGLKFSTSNGAPAMPGVA